MTEVHCSHLHRSQVEVSRDESAGFAGNLALRGAKRTARYSLCRDGRRSGHRARTLYPSSRDRGCRCTACTVPCRREAPCLPVCMCLPLSLPCVSGTYSVPVGRIRSMCQVPRTLSLTLTRRPNESGSGSPGTSLGLTPLNRQLYTLSRMSGGVRRGRRRHPGRIFIATRGRTRGVG